MAKICFYCGKELAAGEKCTCRTSAYTNTGGHSASSGSAGAKGAGRSSGKDEKADRAERNDRTEQANRASREQERRARQNAREQAKEQARRFDQEKRKSQPRFNWRAFLMQLMTSGGYSQTDPLPKKIGYSLLQCLIRPITAIETFVQRQDFNLSIFYLLLFSIAAGLASCRFLGFTWLLFAEGSLMGLSVALILNGLFILVFRFLSKLKYSFRQILSAFSTPAFFYSLFFLFAATGRSTVISFVMTIMTGIVAGSIMHYIALKSLSRQSSDHLVINVILVYVIFFSVTGIIINLLVPVSSVI